MRYWFGGQGGHSARKIMVRKNIEKLLQCCLHLKDGCERSNMGAKEQQNKKS
jgi:hypothetical protein